MSLLQLKVKNLRRPLYPGIVAAVLFSLLLSSCQKEYDMFKTDRLDSDVDWNPEVAIPLIESEITLRDALDRFDDEDIVIVDSDGLLALRYSSNIFSLTAQDAFDLQDQDFEINVPITAGEVATVIGGNDAVNDPPAQQFTLDLTAFNNSGTSNAPELETVTYNNGVFSFNVTNNLGCDSEWRFSIPELQLNGVGLTGTLFVPSGIPSTFSIPLDDWVLDMSADPNEVTVDVEVTYLTGNTNPIFGQGSTVNVRVENQDFRLMTGDFENQPVPIPLDSVRIRLFNNNTEGDIFWEDPTLKTFFVNSFGAELDLTTNTFYALDEDENETLQVISPFDNTVRIGADATIGGVVVDSVILNDNNTAVPSNVKDIAAIEPNFLIYQVDINADPAGSSIVPNWVADTSRLRMDIEAFLPFFGTAEQFTKSDTTEVDIFPLEDDLEQIVSVQLRIIIENGFPIAGSAQVRFMDSNYVVIDSVFEDGLQQVISSGQVINQRVDQVNGRVIKITDILLDRALLEKLEDAGMRYFELTGVVETTRDNDGTQAPVKIFSDYSMKLNLAMKIEAQANTGDL